MLLGAVVGVVAGVAMVAGLLVSTSASAPLALPVSSPVAPGAALADPPAGSRAREVLRHWDAARARAWTTSDPVALARLYTPGSVAGRRDVAMLRAWRERGVRVTRLTTQVLRVRVVRAEERRLVVEVTDRVAEVRTVGLGDTTLPQDRASTRRVFFARSDGRWLVAAVSPDRPGRS